MKNLRSSIFALTTLSLLLGCGGLSSSTGSSSSSCGPKQSSYDTTSSFFLNALSAPNSFLTGGYSGGTKMAQSFTPTSNITVTKVTLPLKASGNPEGTTVTVGIYSDFSGAPLTALATGSLLIDMTGGDANLSTSTVKNIEFSLSSSVALTSGTLYWIQATHDPAASDTNRPIWMAKTSNPYSGGGAYGYNTGTTTWVALTILATAVDLSFTLKCD
ncbi:MAG: hypothetical protein JNL01_09090 [Bdellovibrionales bacterium]|nr:hypothetical protein [Bdellovibrionales bacterium]